jgi:hypothetical protein
MKHRPKFSFVRILKNAPPIFQEKYSCKKCGDEIRILNVNIRRSIYVLSSTFIAVVVYLFADELCKFIMLRIGYDEIDRIFLSVNLLLYYYLLILIFSPLFLVFGIYLPHKIIFLFSKFESIEKENELCLKEKMDNIQKKKKKLKLVHILVIILILLPSVVLVSRSIHTSDIKTANIRDVGTIRVPKDWAIVHTRFGSVYITENNVKVDQNGEITNKNDINIFFQSTSYYQEVSDMVRVSRSGIDIYPPIKGTGSLQIKIMLHENIYKDSNDNQFTEYSLLLLGGSTNNITLYSHTLDRESVLTITKSFKPFS